MTDLKQVVRDEQQALLDRLEGKIGKDALVDAFNA